jgi:hypothetical protein
MEPNAQRDQAVRRSRGPNGEDKENSKDCSAHRFGIVMQTLLSCSVENCFYFVFRERALERLMRDDLF